MKNLTYILLLSMFSFACQDDFNPVSDFKDKYVVNGIINSYVKIFKFNGYSDSGFECRVFISKNLNTLGNSANEDSSNELIRGASVSLVQDSAHVFKLSDKDSLGNKFNYYYTKIDSKRLAGRNIKLVVVTSDGKTLTSSTTLANIALPLFEADEAFEFGITPRIDQQKWGSGATFILFPKANFHILFSKMIIPYHIISSDTYSQIEVPASVVQRNGNLEFIYPKPFSNDRFTYDFSAIDAALAAISGNNPDKKDYEMVNCIVSLRSYDKELSAFYSTTNGYLDQYSLRVDENVYSNIDGGLGIFGSYSEIILDFPIDLRYIKQFGYVYNLPDRQRPVNSLR